MRRPNGNENYGTQRGFSYVEVLIATVIIAAALAPAIEGLHGGLTGAAVHEELTAGHFELDSRIETLAAEPFASLDAEAEAIADPAVPSSYSDAPGTVRRRLVYLSRYDGDDADADGDPFTGVDEGLLWIRVAIENSAHARETLLVR